MDIPEVRYLRTERGSIAYQRFGEGGRTIVWAGPPTVSIDSRWSRPGDLQLWEFLASLGEVLLFDYRGVGISDRLPVSRVGDLDELCFDLKAVVGELASPPTVLIATTWATGPAIAYAAEHADRLERMVLLNAWARVWATDADERVAMFRSDWGTGVVMARGSGTTLGLSQRWQAGHHERIVATPDVAAALIGALHRHDVSALLERVVIPTMVIYTGDIAGLPPEQCEAVASAIPGARYLLRPSAFFNWGEWDSDIHEFITGDRPDSAANRDLAAIVFTDIVDSSRTAAERGDAVWRQTLQRLDDLVARLVKNERGRIVKQTGDGHLLEFARPGDALTASQRLVAEVGMLGVELRIGVHFGEVERRADGDVGGLAVHLAARVAAEASAHEILVSRTVADLTIGDGRRYTPRPAKPLKGVPGEWTLLSLDFA